MPELGPYGSVRGALSNERPYRDLRNVVANYPERPRRFPRFQPSSGHRDHSRLSCGEDERLASFLRDSYCNFNHISVRSFILSGAPAFAFQLLGSRAWWQALVPKRRRIALRLLGHLGAGCDAGGLRKVHVAELHAVRGQYRPNGIAIIVD